MPTNITQKDDVQNGTTSFRVEGEMLAEDAILLEKIAADVRASSGREIVLDLADLDFLDSDSAAILKRLADTQGFTIEGLEFFLQSAINTAERSGR